jgi:hypothetical protein
MAKGLPWKKMGNPGEQRERLVAEMKLNVTAKQLCRGLPHSFLVYLSTVKDL